MEEQQQAGVMMQDVCDAIGPRGAVIMGRQTYPPAPLDLLPWMVRTV